MSVRRSLVRSAFAGIVPCIALLASPQPGAAQHETVERAGDLVMLAAPAVALGTTLALRDYDGSRQFFLGLAAAGVVTGGLKLLVDKDRPDGSDKDSFPSGHAAIAFHSATFIHLRYGLRYGAPAYAAAAFVGYSRVEAKRHYVEDVLMSVAISALSARLFTDRRGEVGSARGRGLDSGVDFGLGVSHENGLTLSFSRTPRF